ncbi:unnamed protein product [Ilex paraguariensis]|uniref:Uncharacterized protein n=1 Tax=Ilex paraguariensis TaxID=185542 RepID=A0ABC8TRQ1_9AQUA
MSSQNLMSSEKEKIRRFCSFHSDGASSTEVGSGAARGYDSVEVLVKPAMGAREKAALMWGRRATGGALIEWCFVVLGCAEEAHIRPGAAGGATMALGVAGRALMVLVAVGGRPFCRPQLERCP